MFVDIFTSSYYIRSFFFISFFQLTTRRKILGNDHQWKFTYFFMFVNNKACFIFYNIYDENNVIFQKWFVICFKSFIRFVIFLSISLDIVDITVVIYLYLKNYLFNIIPKIVIEEIHIWETKIILIF